ncbi:hypothetical protein [Clostridium sp. Marseille-QA1073]
MGVKYGHKILTKDIEEKLIKILNKIANDNNFRILEDYNESINILKKDLRILEIINYKLKYVKES